jgi:hypothetical protein
MAIIRITNPRYAKLRRLKKHVSDLYWWRICNRKKVTFGETIRFNARLVVCVSRPRKSA